MTILNGNTQRFVGWIKDKIDTYLPALEPVETEAPIRSSRFKVTTAADRVLFVYGREEAEAVSRLPEATRAGARIEPAGHVENGELRVPDEEARAVAASTCGRDAPAKPAKRAK